MSAQNHGYPALVLMHLAKYIQVQPTGSHHIALVISLSCVKCLWRETRGVKVLNMNICISADFTLLVSAFLSFRILFHLFSLKRIYSKNTHSCLSWKSEHARKLRLPCLSVCQIKCEISARLGCFHLDKSDEKCLTNYL